MKFATTSHRALGLATLVATFSPLAQAMDTGWYGGVNIGQSEAKIDDAGITRSLLGTGFATTSISDDHRDTGFKLFGGYQFSQNFALEGGFFDLGRFGYTANTLPVGTLSGNLKMKGLNLDAVGILPITEKFSAFARVGLNYAETRDTYSGNGAVAALNRNSRQRDTNYKYGLGLQYDFTPALGMRLEAERYRINDEIGNQGNADLISLGLVYRFGGKSPTAKAMWTSHEPVAADSVYQRMPPFPAGARIEKYCTSLDIQFAINQVDIQHEADEKLAVVGTFMAKYPNTTAVIEGHSDNVGTPEQNMQLSQQRAENVVNYLVANAHIAPSRLTAVGYGETRPLADNSTEEGKRMNRRIDAIIACANDIAGLTVAPARISMALQIEFDQDQTDVKANYADELRKVADFLQANPGVTATVEGHTGNLQTTPERSMEISRHRAQNVVNILVDEFGVARNRLSAEGFGETRRVAYDTSLKDQQDNRRINILFDYPKSR